VIEQPLYLRVGQDTSFVTIHRAVNGSDTAVLLCPPFGWEEVASYRPRRVWAQSLAEAGHTAVRLGLPSTGDSGGTVNDPDRVAAWTDAVGAAAAWLRRETGARRIVAVGMDVGGMLAYRCAARGDEINDLVLWSVSARGRAVVRQLRAFSQLETERFFEGLPHPPPLPDGELEAGGFRLSAQTVRDIAALDLASLPFAEAADRRVLMLERDGIAVDSRLHDRLTELGAVVTTAPGDGYGDMTAHPQTAQPAKAVFARVAAWLAEAGGTPSPRSAASRLDAVADDRMQSAEDGWTETPLRLDRDGVTLSGVLTEPARPAGGGLCAVLLDTGAVRRIGPSRMWVQTARRWARRGIPTLRLDIEGIGDASGPAVAFPEDGLFHRPELLDQVRCALDALQERGVGTTFLLGGLCSGGYWSLRLCASDERVAAAALLNCRVVAWDEGLTGGRYIRILLTQRPSLARIRRAASPQLVREMLRWLVALPARGLRALRLLRRQAASGGSETDRVLGALRDSGRRVLFLFSEREPLSDELARSGWRQKLEQSPAISFEHIAVNDHTLRPGWAQEQAQAILDRFLDAELGAAAADPVSSASEPA
jgi:pimeloyl-ACP methyl ester carboxylesterase